MSTWRHAILAAGLGFFPLAAAPPPPEAPRAPEASRARKGWIGVFFGDAVDGGAQIIEVVPEGPAALAGLTAGDLVIRIDGKDVADRAGLSRELERRGPGDAMSVTILREGETKDAKVVLGAPPSSPRIPPRVWVPSGDATSAAQVLGIGVGEIPSDLRRALGGPGEAGLLVLKVDASGAAAEALHAGDLLVECAGQPVATEADLDRVILTRSSGPIQVSGRRSKQAFTSEIALRLKSPEQRARETRARYLEATIRQLETQLAELKRQLETLTAGP